MTTLLGQKIKVLKNDLQNLLDKDHIDEYNNKKQELESTLKLLQSEKEIQKVQRHTDNMAYKQHPDKLESVKLDRLLAKQKYDHLKEIEQEYYLNESINIPGFLFFDKKILSNYGECPFIKFDIDKRKEWLDNTSDHGELYYKLYEKVVNKNVLLNLEHELNLLDTQIENDILHNLDDHYKNIYLNTIEELKKYIDTKTKTKKIKESFKLIINNITLLITTCNLRLDVFIELKYSHPILINKDIKIINILFDDKINKYKELIEGIETEKLFIKNTDRYLKLDLLEYLNKQSKHKIIKHEYTCPKKWTELSIDEKELVFQSFAKVYVNNELICNELIDKELQTEIYENLFNFLKEKINIIKVKNISWNKCGYINKIFKLHWDNDQRIFTLKIDKEIHEQKKIIKKPSSVKSILTKYNEKIINEEIIKCILINKTPDNELIDLNLETFKKTCIESIKDKLKIKRVLNVDKDKIYLKINEIYNIIINH